MAEPMSSPLVSVVMSLYNSERYLAEAIDSVLAQTFSNFEFIIIDDGSTDGSEEIVRSYSDPRIVFVKQANTGLAQVLNNAIDLSKGELIARMDPDDCCYPGRLAQQLEYMNSHPDVVAVGSAVNFVDADGEEICIFRNPESDEILRRRFPASPFVHPSVMFRKEICTAAGMYPSYMRHGGEDVVLFGRMSKFGKLANLQDILMKYRITPGSLSRKPKDFRDLLQSIIVEAINGEEVAADSLELLERSSGRLSERDRAYHYHFDVAKLILWAGGNAATARRHLSGCISLHPLRMGARLLFLISYIPSAWINYGYRKAKRTDIAAESRSGSVS